jgi:hypothetical protein
VILAGESAAVEPERDPGWQAHTRDGPGGEVLGGKDDQVRRAAVRVVHVGKTQPSSSAAPGAGANTASLAVA